MQELKKVGVLSAGKIGVLMGVIVGVILAIVSLIVSYASPDAALQGFEAMQLTAVTPLSALFIVIMYAIGGFLGGIIYSALYNIVAKYAGGIKIEFKK